MTPVAPVAPVARGPRAAATWLAASTLLAAALVAGCGSGPTESVPLRPAAAGAPGSILSDSLGPLRVSAENPRYFSRGGRTVYLTGSHTWNTLQDWGASDPPPAFDYDGFLDFLVGHGHNFIRLYVWEQAAWFPGEPRRVTIAPLAYERTGPGTALDGGPRFDLTRFHPEFFARLRRRVVAAGERGVYVSVMLFDGWSIERKGQAGGNPWQGHPLNAANNVNGLDGDSNGDDEGKEIHTLELPEVTALQAAYVRRMVETVGDLDNVLWEISNESHAGSVEWQYEMIRLVRACETEHGWCHPVGMTSLWPEPPEGNAVLWNSPADWISPHDNRAERYRRDPPAATGRKVVLIDTDHIWGVGGSSHWVWESLTRGLNPIFMDPYVTELRKRLPAWPEARTGPLDPAVSREWDGVRRTLGFARFAADRVPLAAMRPQPGSSSTGYCLAAPGSELLVYVPARPGRVRRLAGWFWRDLLGGRFTVDLGSTPARYTAEWIDGTSGRVLPGRPVAGTGRVGFRSPVRPPVLLHLRAEGETP